MSMNFMEPADAEALERAFEQLQSSYADPDPTSSPASAEEEEEGEETSPLPSEEGETSEEEETPEEEETYEIDGRTYTAAELAELARVRDHLLANPGTQQSLDAAAAAVRPAQLAPAAVPTYVPPTPPEELDLDDPTVKFLWEQQLQMHQQLESQRQEMIRRNVIETNAEVERSISDWNLRYSLDESNLAKVRERAASLNVAGSMVANGQSVYNATNSALEAAFWGDESLRSQYLRAAAEAERRTAAADRTKKTKLGALAGRGTTTGHSKPPTEMSADERRAAMISEISDHLARN